MTRRGGAVFVVGRVAAALAWLAVLVVGLAVLSGRTDSSVSTGLFLAAVGLVGLLLVLRAGFATQGPTLDRVPPLVAVDRTRGRRTDPPGLRVSRVTWARRTEQARRRLGRELSELAARRGGPGAADRPALVELREGAGPADAASIAAAVDEAASR